MFKFCLIFSTLLALIGCSSIRDSMTFHPDKRTFIPQDQLPKYFQKITFPTSDGEELSAFYLEHQNRTPQRLAIYFHGNSGNLYHRLEWVNQMYLKGINVLIVDYRGYGQSSGEPSEDGIYEDGRSTIKYAIDSLNYPVNQLNIIGRSIGTTVAIEVSQDMDLESLTLITPLTSGKEMGEIIAPSIASVAMDSFDSKSKAARIKARTLIIHGSSDKLTPITMGYEIYHLLEVEDKTFVEIPGGGHNDLQDVAPKLFWGSLYHFLKLPI